MTPTQRNDIAGAIFDFAGFLTAHKEVIAVGSTASASPMVSRIQEWAEARGLSLESPNVMTWNEALAEPAPVQDECSACSGHGLVGNVLDTVTCPCCRGSGVGPAPVQEPVAEITGVDEYGPLLGWHTHWAQFPDGTKLYTDTVREPSQMLTDVRAMFTAPQPQQPAPPADVPMLSTQERLNIITQFTIAGTLGDLIVHVEKLVRQKAGLP